MKLHSPKITSGLKSLIQNKERALIPYFELGSKSRVHLLVV